MSPLSSILRRTTATLAVVLAGLTVTGSEASAAAGPASPPHVGERARHPVLRSVADYDFGKGETAENVAVAPDGTVYVTLALAATLEIRRPNGSVEHLHVDAGPGGGLAGVALDGRGDVWIDVSSPDPDRIGIYRLRRLGDGALAAPERVAELPVGGAPNGIAVDPSGNLYVADSVKGVIHRLPVGAKKVETWAGGPLLSQDTTQSLDGIVFPGPNGIKVFRGAVYVSNSSRYDVLRVPIRRDGTAGPVENRYPGVVADDFAFDVAGNLYVTTDPFQTVARVTPDGTRTVLATRADGLDGPSALAFGTGVHRDDVYITNLGFFGTTHRPSLQLLHVGVPGAPVPPRQEH